MNIEELENKIKELQEELENLKGAYLLPDAEKEENKRWRADTYENYFYVTSDLEINITDDNNAFDYRRYKYHNYFQTKEEAQAVADNIKTHIELMELAEELNTEPIDWKDEMQEKYYLFYDCEGENIDYDISYLGKNANIVYCTNSNFKDEAIKRIGEERLIKYLKGI